MGCMGGLYDGSVEVMRVAGCMGGYVVHARCGESKLWLGGGLKPPRV